MADVGVAFPARLPIGGDELPGVALVTIARPDVLNALDTATMTTLVEALRRLDADASCRCIVLTGAGERAFAAGADIAEMASLDAAAAARASGLFERWDEVAAIETPRIAAVRGHALGGGLELALACDVIIAADDARFGQPEVRLGIMPGVGGTQRLTRAVGRSTAMAMILGGRQLDANEARSVGLVAAVVPPDEVVAEGLRLAAEIAAGAPLAVRAAKAAVDAAFETSLADGLARERAAFLELFDTEDRAEGMRAFLEKRPPEWKGR